MPRIVAIDLERQRHRQPGHEVHRAVGRQPVQQVAHDGIDQRQRVGLQPPPDEDRRHDGAPHVVVVAVHLDHRRPDDVGEDPLVGSRGVRLVVAEDRRDVVVAGQQPAVVDRVVEQRLVVAQRAPRPGTDRRSRAARAGHRAGWPCARPPDVERGRRRGGDSGDAPLGERELVWCGSAGAGQAHVHDGQLTGAVAPWTPNDAGFVRPTRVVVLLGHRVGSLNICHWHFWRTLGSLFVSG